MSDCFPKGFDALQHSRLRILYGDLVPPLDQICVRAGWWPVVDQMFARLGRIQNQRDFRVLSVEARCTGDLIVRYTGLAVGVPDIIYEAERAAACTCEHCGQPARNALKVRLESLVTSPHDDRLLCTDCGHKFQKEIAQ